MPPVNRPRETTKFWRVPHITGLELLHATYITQNFSRHMHDCFAFGVVEQGVQAYYYRGDHHLATPGSIVNCVPGEVHDGHAATANGWTYRMFYPTPGLIKVVAAELTGRQQVNPFFGQTVIHDADLARRLHTLHRSLEDSAAPRLAHESLLLDAVAMLLTRYAEQPPVLAPTGAEPGPVRRVRDLIETRYTENLSLDELAAVAHLSPFYLVRVFTKEIGLPPHAYLVQTRVMRARDLLRAGVSAAQAAVDVGFVDQSHLHRHFKRVMGMTPRTYQA